MAYVPPRCDSIPFVFGPNGYTVPLCTEVTFDFIAQIESGTLQAAINVMQPIDYLNSTYTYTKSCPVYTIGYGDGSTQLMRGKCLYAGIRDINASIIGSPPDYHINNIGALVRGFATEGISANIALHDPGTISASVKPVHNTYASLSGRLDGFTTNDLSCIFPGVHLPSELGSNVFIKQRENRYLQSSIMSWAEKSLSAALSIISSTDFQAIIQTIEPSNLSAYIKDRQVSVLRASVTSWGEHSLNAYIKQIYSSDMGSIISGRNDMWSSVRASMKGTGSEYRSISSSIGPMQLRDISSTIRATYLSNLSAYIYAVTYSNLLSSIISWDIKTLSASIVSDNYPWNLTASITASGSTNTLTGLINGLQSVCNYNNFRCLIHSLQIESITANITGDGAPCLSAYLMPVGNASNLHAIIYPKVIRLTTVVSVSTLANRDLSSIINSSCFKTGYSTLPAYIHPKFKGDLQGYIKGTSLQYNYSNLSARSGYTDSYAEVDRLPLNISILPGDFYTFNRYRIMVKMYEGNGLLQASINGTLRYNDLQTSIRAVDLNSYTFEGVFKNRETVIHRTYDGMYISYETVEMAFGSIVNDYYYSSDGNKVWKKDRLDRWMLDVKSMLPEDTALKLKRRLHRATSLYDLKKFISIDEAMRYAIAYVTEQPQSTLPASIYNRGTFSHIGASINPHYTIRSNYSLTSSINPVNNSVVIGLPESIFKI